MSGTNNLIGIKGETRIPNVIPPPYPEIPETIDANKATNKSMPIWK